MFNFLDGGFPKGGDGVNFPNGGDGVNFPNQVRHRFFYKMQIVLLLQEYSGEELSIQNITHDISNAVNVVGNAIWGADALGDALAVIPEYLPEIIPFLIP